MTEVLTTIEHLLVETIVWPPPAGADSYSTRANAYPLDLVALANLEDELYA